MITEHLSPNFGSRKNELKPDILLLHYTDMVNLDAVLERLSDPDAAVGAHYLIAEDGRVFRLVDEEMRAWHAGVAFWKGERDINSCSIGIELMNPGHSHGYRAFPKPQIKALIELGSEICGRWNIPASRVLGHSDVAPGRKFDPGHLFPWQQLAREGLGLFPIADRTNQVSETDLPQALSEIGYEVSAENSQDPMTRAAWHAFQRHWCGEELGAPPSEFSLGMLSAVRSAMTAQGSSSTDST